MSEPGAGRTPGTTPHERSTPEALRAHPADEPRVSVVVPVYDAMPYLRTLLVSLLAQDLGPDAYEVVAVDDGSTDDGPRLLDELARVHPQLRVVHQENSGWPGAPRNRGLDLARGRYVFFADADDEMGPRALRLLADLADEHGSDVVLPEVVGVGRYVPQIADSTQADVDLEAAFRTLTPQKLFRRSFLEEQQLRFPEEKVRLEDGMLLARAYLLARRVSYLHGEEFYRLIARDDGQNISSQAFDPDGYTWSVAEISRIVRQLDPDPARADRVVLDLYRRKCLKFYQPARWAAMPRARQDAFLAAHGRFLAEHVPPALEDQLAEPYRTRSRRVRAGDAAGLTADARAALDAGLGAARLVRARWGRTGRLHLEVEVHGARAEGRDRLLELQVGLRGGGTVAAPDLRLGRHVEQPGAAPAVRVVEATLDRSVLDLRQDDILDLHVRVAEGREKARVAVPLVSALPPARHGLQVYRTVKGNLSIQREPR